MTTDILSLIDVEIAKLQQARALLLSSGKRRPGRPKSVVAPVAKPKRTISKTHRTAIAAAQRKRWAAQKRAAAK
jgi:hypothetical protein